jgi:hypothetical protein
VAAVALWLYQVATEKTEVLAAGLGILELAALEYQGKDLPEVAAVAQILLVVVALGLPQQLLMVLMVL